MAPKLYPQAQRLRTIIVTVPIMGATAYVLFERLVHGKPQKTLPRRDDTYESGQHAGPPGKGTEKIGMSGEES
ncbi:hypothetical protein EV363DRAFT_1170265 [Boletus edulis]|nr:hypothetical protein EV363DRAFT_1170265 [Boletus edulis]